MTSKDEYYIKLADSVHERIVQWDPLSFKVFGDPSEGYDSLEKRFISGIINSENDEIILKKVKKNLQYLGIDFVEIGTEEERKLEDEIIKILSELRKTHS